MILTEMSGRGINPNFADRALIEAHWEPISSIKLYQLERPSSRLVFDRSIGYLVHATTPHESLPGTVLTAATFHVIKDPHIREGNAHLTHFSQSQSGETQGVCAEIGFNRFTRTVHAEVQASTIDPDVSGIDSVEVVLAQSYATEKAACLSAVRLAVTAAVRERLKETGLHLPESGQSYVEAVVVDRNADPEYYISSPGTSTHHTHKVDMLTLIAAGIQIPEIAFNGNSVFMQLNDLTLGINAEAINEPVRNVTEGRFVFPLYANQSGRDLLNDEKAG